MSQLSQILQDERDLENFDKKLQLFREFLEESFKNGMDLKESEVFYLFYEAVKKIYLKRIYDVDLILRKQYSNFYTNLKTTLTEKLKNIQKIQEIFLTSNKLNRLKNKAQQKSKLIYRMVDEQLLSIDLLFKNFVQYN